MSIAKNLPCAMREFAGRRLKASGVLPLDGSPLLPASAVEHYHFTLHRGHRRTAIGDVPQKQRNAPGAPGCCIPPHWRCPQRSVAPRRKQDLNVPGRA
jgi:hypothetical protein